MKSVRLSWPSIVFLKLEYIIHIAYRIELRTWQVRGEAQKITFRQRKLEIQKRFWEQMGLNIDKPKANGLGTTNDGNTSRRAFNQTEKFAEVTDVDEQLIKRFAELKGKPLNIYFFLAPFWLKANIKNVMIYSQKLYT
jgi:hypothetical protein